MSVWKMHIYFVLCLSLFSASNTDHRLGVLFKKILFFHDSGARKAYYEGAGICVEGNILMSRERVMSQLIFLTHCQRNIGLPINDPSSSDHYRSS